MIALKNLRYIIPLLTGLMLSGPGIAQQTQLPDSIVTLESIPLELTTDTRMVADTHELGHVIWKDSPVLAMLDSLAALRYYGEYEFIIDRDSLNIYGFGPDEVPSYPDSVVAARIDSLNQETTIELAFNKVIKDYIYLYANKKRDLTARMLGLAELYFPLFEEQLDRYDIPLEMKYLAIVESALNPTAGSRAGAKGLWQFMYGTGKVYGLKVTTLIDERFDPLQSTIAACEHMNDLYDIYGDWSLVMAAYNSGAGNVNKAIRRSGGVKSYWAIWPFLPRETRGYVPAFIAVYYVMTHASAHNIYPVHPGILYHETDTVMVHDVLSFDQINEMLGVPMDQIKLLNPLYKKGIIPYKDGEQFFLMLPKEYIGDFINNEQQLYAYVTRKGTEKEKLLAEIKKAQERTIHIVRSGENLGLIASRYHVYVSQIKAWNNMRGTTIYPGQRLVVYPSARYNPSVVPQKQTAAASPAPNGTHTVRSGENLGLIANKYGCSVSQLKAWNNLSRSTIHPGQKLKVRKPEASIKVDENAEYVYHTVKSGDTLWDIAKLYDGVTVNQIKELNNITNARRLKPGDKIRIAVKGS
ncbi:MAG: LysM peptidoglycan-binding domain-containing protein [Bacteroidales bacterium]|jgi:membrane-bound lytic murein transglycosylase D|nr:LysM peptidoglycan-binding domain-containing protein [Bacteroidales bacterium]